MNGFMKSLFLTAVCIALAAPLGATRAIHWVPTDYATIQEAIDASSSGDWVLVLPGTYVENINFEGKEIILRSDADHDESTHDIDAVNTVLDGNQAGSVVTFDSYEGPDTLLEGFTITNGSGTYDGSHYYRGCGIYCDFAYPTILNNIIEANSSPASSPGAGGGIYCQSAHPHIVGNKIQGNSIWSGSLGHSESGGGLNIDAQSNPLVEDNDFIGNDAVIGGGISCEGAAIIRNNEITANATKYGSGGGISLYYSSATVVDNYIHHNSAWYSGGGIVSQYGEPQCINNTIQHNAAGRHAGGIYAGGHTYGGAEYDILIKDNNISYNECVGHGGGIYTGDEAKIIGNDIIGNTADTNSAAYDGGGIYCYIGSFFYATVSNNRIHGNHVLSGDGGGIHTYGCVVLNNFIDDNWAHNGSGGGVYSLGSTIVNNTIYQNRCADGSDGGGLYCATNSTLLVNCILWENIIFPSQALDQIGGVPDVTYCNVQGGWPGTGNIDEDPLWVDPENGDFHLTMNSPCIDAGTNSAPSLPLRDFEGDPRIILGLAPGYGKGVLPLGGPVVPGIVDMGADEYCQVKFRKLLHSIQ